MEVEIYVLIIYLYVYEHMCIDRYVHHVREAFKKFSKSGYYM